MAVPLKRQAATNGSKGTLATAVSKSASKPHTSAKKPSGVHLRPAAALEETKSRGSMASGDNDDFDYILIVVSHATHLFIICMTLY